MAGDASRPRFLLESGTYQFDNVGDIAMLQATCQRIRERFPDARLDVVTEQPERLQRVLPDAHPVLASSWFRQPIVPVPSFMKWWKTTSRLRWWERRLGHGWPRLANLGKQWHARRDDNGAPDNARAYFKALRKADAVICSGGGFLNDFYHEHAFKILTTLHAAKGMAKPAALFGVGIGPWTRHDLREIGEPILKRIDVITLRENLISPGVLQSAGITSNASNPLAKTRVTGDDATLLAADTPMQVREFPLDFAARREGTSKLDRAIVFDFLAGLYDKALGRLIPTRFALFG
ncbi:MAG: polysaccharide pyruvyl transferase family protein, partial [Planctomycetota bacterium]